MIWIYTNIEPLPVEERQTDGMAQKIVNYIIQPLGESDLSGYRYKYKSVTMEPGIWHFGAIVSALIRAEYPADKMEAIQNNWMADPTNDNAVEEMLEMQNWRASAKFIAREAIRYVARINGETPPPLPKDHEINGWS